MPVILAAPAHSTRDSLAQNGGMGDVNAPFTCRRLAELLESEGHSPDSYGIGRRGKYRDQAFILDRWSKHWVVYYTERGGKTGIRKHASEDAACRDLLARVRGETTQRG
jgi:hypothetical protein